MPDWRIENVISNVSWKIITLSWLSYQDVIRHCLSVRIFWGSAACEKQIHYLLQAKESPVILFSSPTGVNRLRPAAGLLKVGGWGGRGGESNFSIDAENGCECSLISFLICLCSCVSSTIFQVIEIWPINQDGDNLFLVRVHVNSVLRLCSLEFLPEILLLSWFHNPHTSTVPEDQHVFVNTCTSWVIHGLLLVNSKTPHTPVNTTKYQCWHKS